MTHPYNETKILNGVSSLNDNFSYIIRIKDKVEEGTFGTTTSREQALTIIENIGKHELALLQKKTDQVWNKIESKFDESKMTYTITLQKLGRITNGPITVHTLIYIEEVLKVYPSVDPVVPKV